MLVDSGLVAVVVVGALEREGDIYRERERQSGVDVHRYRLLNGCD